MRNLRVWFVIICLLLFTSISTAETNDNMLAAILDKMYVSATNFPNGISEVGQSAVPILSIDEAKVLLDSCATFVSSLQTTESTIYVYQGDRDFLLFVVPSNSANWALHYVNNTDHNAINPYLISCISQFQSYGSAPECWINKVECFVPTHVPFHGASTTYIAQQEYVYEYVFYDGITYSVTTDYFGQITHIEITVNDLIRELFENIT